MTTIQDRIIKDFKEKFGKYKYLCRYSDDFKKGEWKNLDEVKQFLIQSIKLVQEETRNEIIGKVEKEFLFLSKLDKEFRSNPMLIKSLGKIKSITNKEKQK